MVTFKIKAISPACFNKLIKYTRNSFYIKIRIDQLDDLTYHTVTKEDILWKQEENFLNNLQQSLAALV